MDTKKAYCCALKREDKDWWYRGKDEKSSGDSVISWRIGWYRGVHRALGDEELPCFIEFLKNIEGGKEAWSHGRKIGKKEACSTTREYEQVIDFQHAAWLLGWFEGYSETRGADVGKHGRGRGSGVGKTAGEFYNDPKVKKKLR